MRLARKRGPSDTVNWEDGTEQMKVLATLTGFLEDDRSFPARGSACTERAWYQASLLMGMLGKKTNAKVLSCRAGQGRRPLA